MKCEVCGYEKDTKAAEYRYLFNIEPLTAQTFGVVLFEQGKPTKFVIQFIWHEKPVTFVLPADITHLIYAGWGSNFDLNFILLTQAQAQILPVTCCEPCFKKILAQQTVSLAPYMNTNEDGYDDPEIKQITLGK